MPTRSFYCREHSCFVALCRNKGDLLTLWKHNGPRSFRKHQHSYCSSVAFTFRGDDAEVGLKRQVAAKTPDLQFIQSTLGNGMLLIGLAMTCH
jgi:hypothetical protein